MAKIRMMQTGLDNPCIRIGPGSREGAKRRVRAGEAETVEKKNLKGAPENKMLKPEENKGVARKKPYKRKT